MDFQDPLVLFYTVNALVNQIIEEVEESAVVSCLVNPWSQIFIIAYHI